MAERSRRQYSPMFSATTVDNAVGGVPNMALQTVVEQALQAHVPNAQPVPPPEAHGSSPVELL